MSVTGRAVLGMARKDLQANKKWHGICSHILGTDRFRAQSAANISRKQLHCSSICGGIPKRVGTFVVVRVARVAHWYTLEPYVCDLPGCGKAFAIAGALTIHKRTHNGVKPFKCKYCEKY
jgi:hypothetical protein